MTRYILETEVQKEESGSIRTISETKRKRKETIKRNKTIQKQKVLNDDGPRSIVFR